MPLTPDERFWSKVHKTRSCWVWTAALMGSGYGAFWIDGKVVPAHVYAYKTMVGELGEGEEPDHACDNRACVRPGPRHVRPLLRSKNRGRYQTEKTHCPEGHPYDEENTYYRKDRPGRHCRKCKRKGDREMRKRKKEANHIASEALS